MSKTVSLAEVAKHGTATSCYMVIHDKVYDITPFLDQHPGGEEVLLDHAGKDATEAFEDVGHSEDARNMLAKYLVGDLPAEEKASAKKKENKAPGAPAENSDSWTRLIVVAVVLAAAAVAYKYFM